MLQFSLSVLSNSLWPHESQHARPPCPSPTHEVHPDSCASTQWCHPAVSSSVVLFSSCPQSIPVSGSFPMGQLFAWGGLSIGVSALVSVLPMNMPWDFFGRSDAKAETPVLWPPHAKSWLIGKHSDAGRDWGHEEKGTTEDEMAGWHHWLDGCESEWTPGVGDGQRGLACCDPWGRKESDMTERLNWTEWTPRTDLL